MTELTIRPEEIRDALSKYVEDFDALRQQLHLAKWTVVGHSWGSMVAHAYVAAHPKQVAGVVFLGDVGPDTTSFIFDAPLAEIKIQSQIQKLTLFDARGYGQDFAEAAE